MANTSGTVPAQRIALLLPSLAGGGAERSMLQLAGSFSEQGRHVDLLVFRLKGAFMESVPEAVRLVELEAGSGMWGRILAARADPAGVGSLLKPVLLPIKTDADIRHIHTLKRYLETQQPDILLSALTYTNLVALWAKRLSDAKTPIIVSERIVLSAHLHKQNRWSQRHIRPMVRRSYPFADGIVSVSDNVADDLAGYANFDRNRITTIYNPVVDDTLSELAAQPLRHPWFQPGQPPVILGVGRLIPQKDFETLLRAFAALRREKELRLVVLGEGRQRSELEAIAQELGIAIDVELPGFVDNPYQYMARASVFVLTSLYEGLPGVLIQAMACGCPVISTDCPGGSREILADGKFGKLCPVKDEKGLASAINDMLDNPVARETLRTRASEFSVEHSTSRYLEYLDEKVGYKAN